MSINIVDIRHECTETSVVCPVCYAAIGARCTEPRKGSNGVVGTGSWPVEYYHPERIKLIQS